MTFSATNHGMRKALSVCVSACTFLCACLVLAPLGLVFVNLVQMGARSLNLAFFTNLPAGPGVAGGGMANAIAGTLILIGLASVIGIPAGVMGGVFLSEFGSSRVNWFIRFLCDILNGVPSIIWGIVINGLVVVPGVIIAGHVIIPKGFSAYAGGLALGCLMIPLVMRTTEEVLVLVPHGYREAALALGIARWRTTVHIVMQTAARGILTGILLALARVAGETAPLLFTALGDNFWNNDLTKPIAALPLQIFTYANSAYPDWHRQAWAGALVLVAFIFTLNISVRFLTRGKPVRV
ncbi:MAG TPA: phosphate ABC transporter permease PstA [Chthoniobacteraceae bacterium]|jgi:phosphate transport system permease protein|nr:phosphate ABC transporter permease PstA [Chthoniobacteraceae bacterium]